MSEEPKQEKTLDQIRESVSGYSNWRKLTLEEIKFEYMVEYPKLKIEYGDVYPRFKDFYDAIRNGEIIKVTKSLDRKISYRSNTRTLKELKRLVSSYRFPRDVDRIVQGIEDNEKIPYPIVTRDEKGNLRIFGGNTRMDVSFILGINPSVMVIDL